MSQSSITQNLQNLLILGSEQMDDLFGLIYLLFTSFMNVYWALTLDMYLAHPLYIDH